MSNLVISPGPVTTVTLNRPEVRNALSEELIAELADWAGTVTADGTVRVVVLAGAGTAFCAGADIGWMTRVAGYSHEENLEDARRAARMFHLLDNLPVPVIGRIQGAALGGGAGLTAICDVAVAASDTLFGFPETTLGIVPAMIGPYVIRKIGFSAARALCLSGARFPASRALHIGLVHDVVAPDQIDAAVDRQVQQFSRTAPSAVAHAKRLLREIDGRRPADVLALTVDAIALQRASPEGQEGLRAFLEKRKPSWATSDDAAPRGPSGAPARGR